MSRFINNNAFSDEFKKERIILLNRPIDSNSSEEIAAQLLILNSINDKPIHLYLSSPGGCIYSGLKIIDMMRMIKAPVHIFCTGIVASMGVIIAVSGARGNRYASENCTFMIHSPIAHFGEKLSFPDLDIQVKETERLKNIIEGIVSKATGKSKKTISEDTSRDRYLSAEEALKYGIIDKIIKTEHN